jgi:type IV pilus assembly protein PilN
MPRINLLPWRESERKRKRQEFLFAAGGTIVLALLLGFVVKWQFESAIDRQNERNQLLTSEIAQLDKQITEILGLEQQKQRLLARMQVIEQLQRSRPEAVHLLDQLARTLPDGVYLTSIKQADRRVQLKGVAQSSTRVATFLRNIDASPFLQDPSLEVLENKGGAAGSQFALNAVQSSQQPAAEEAPAPGNKKKAGAARAGARQ